jgi:hypothetical protein
VFAAHHISGGFTVALSEREHQLEAELAAERQKADRKALVIAGIIGLIGAASAVTYGSDAINGSVVGTGRVLVGLLGVAAALMLRLQPGNGWLLAMAWALIQIPVYAWSPEGSPNVQALSLPLVMTNSTRLNGEVVSYLSVGVNLAGVVLAVVLKAFKSALVR